MKTFIRRKKKEEANKIITGLPFISVTDIQQSKSSMVFNGDSYQVSRRGCQEYVLIPASEYMELKNEKI